MSKIKINDAQALAFVQGQSFRVNSRVYEKRYPDLDFGRLVYVETEGNPWAPGVMTYISDQSGAANWLSAYAKDVPLADVSQEMVLRTFQLAGIGYHWNIAEVNTALSIGGSLPDRRAKAARKSYQQFMYNLTVTGNIEKGLGGLINYSGIPIVTAPAGASSSTYWVDENGVGQKTADEIIRDINLTLQRVNAATNEIVYADTLLLPKEAYLYIAGQKLSAVSDSTILEFVSKNNIYTIQTKQPLTIRTIAELSTASTTGTPGTGRMVAYKNDDEFVKLHLPMPHQFLPVWQDGPMNYTIPGIFRTGGVEFLTTQAAYYLDAISQPLVI